MNFCRISFKRFLDSKHINFSIFNKKNGKHFTRKYYIFLNQDLTHNNTTKMSRKQPRTHRKNFRIFCEQIWTGRGVYSNFQQVYARKGRGRIAKMETGPKRWGRAWSGSNHGLNRFSGLYKAMNRFLAHFTHLSLSLKTFSFSL
jgi:hypothetical protein